MIRRRSFLVEVNPMQKQGCPRSLCPEKHDDSHDARRKAAAAISSDDHLGENCAAGWQGLG
jgi:hypothetical protein